MTELKLPVQGWLTLVLEDGLKADIEENKITVSKPDEDRRRPKVESIDTAKKR